ncbi:MAG: hypothetical protein ABSH05_05730 [Bryobacteraceae bacterium]|jgi:hypothetical protein
MALTGKSLMVLLSIAVASAGDKEKPPFKPGPVESYPFRQTLDQVTIAAAVLRSDAETEPAFGKLSLNRYGILPILVVMRNDSGKTLALDRLKLEFITPDRDHIEPTPPSEIRYLRGASLPNPVGGPPVPGMPPRVSRKKNPLDAWEIEGRAFAARMLPPHESASGFFYFRAFYRSGSVLYLRGLREASSGKELFYFEIPLDKETSEYPIRRREPRPQFGRYPFP